MQRFLSLHVVFYENSACGSLCEFCVEIYIKKFSLRATDFHSSTFISLKPKIPFYLTTNYTKLAKGKRHLPRVVKSPLECGFLLYRSRGVRTCEDHNLRGSDNETDLVY